MKIVVLGCGAILEQGHRKPLEHVAKTLDCHVAGLVDVNPKRLAQAGKWFPKAEHFASAEACFAKLKDVSLTIVISPPPMHAANIEVAVTAGSHILCEKPLAGSVEDAERIIELVRRHKKVLTVGMTRRYHSCFVEARKRIQDGALGSDITFIHREGGLYRWPVASAAPFRRDTSGGGVLLDKGVHVLDTLEYLFGTGDVESSFDDGSDVSVEANSVVHVSLARAKGHVQLSWDMNLCNGLHISGSEGQYWIPLGPLNTIFSRRKADQPWERLTTRAEWPLDLQPANSRMGCPNGYDDCFLYQLIKAIRAIKLSEKPAVTGEEALSTLRLIKAGYELAKPLRKPWLSKEESKAEAARHWRHPESW